MKTLHRGSRQRSVALHPGVRRTVFEEVAVNLRLQRNKSRRRASAIRNRSESAGVSPDAILAVAPVRPSGELMRRFAQ